MNIIFDQDDQRYQQIEISIQDPIQTTHLISHHQVDVQLTTNQSRTTENKSFLDVNQIFAQPIIDHKWESRYYSGHLIATSGHFVAYALKPQSGDDIVCVFYKQVDFRSVINPPFSGDIHDLAFSFSDDLLLSCVDQASHLRIYRIEQIDEPNELEHTLILFIDLQYKNNEIPSTVSWCCFIPSNSDGDDDQDSYTLMSVTRGSQVEVLNVVIASAQSCISDNLLPLDEIKEGHLSCNDHNGNVTCVCFSPDGTALGTATDQGEIKFFLIDFSQPPTCRCLHVWIPHEGRPISSLYFLDDYQNLTQESPLWRYAISGCDQNREFKIWSCNNWNCLQIIRFKYSLNDSAFQPPSLFPHFQASIDLTSRFLVLSDIHRNCLYVLTIYQHPDGNRAFFSSINAFPTIQSSSLSFAITAGDQLTTDIDESNDSKRYAVKIYSIHATCFQEILLAFKTNSFVDDDRSRLNQSLNDLHFEPYLKSLQTQETSFTLKPSDSQSALATTYRIDDLLTPTNSLANGESTNSVNTADQIRLPSLGPLHGLFLGNTTAFDTIPNQDNDSNEQISPGTAGMTRTLFDVDEKMTVEGLNESKTGFSLDFLTRPSDHVDTNDPNGNEILLSPSKFAENNRWNPSCHSTSDRAIRLGSANGEDMDNYSDPTETSDKDEDSTADEEQKHHMRPKRRSGRSPTSSLDTLHEIRQLTQLLTEFRTPATKMSDADSSRIAFDYEEKLEKCCQRLDLLSNKVDRWITVEQSNVVNRPNRPSPNSAPVEVLTSSEPQKTLSDVNYDRLEQILIEKIQNYLQTAMNSIFEPYHQLRDNLHKELSAKLLATDPVIKQTVGQIFRSKSMIEGITHAIGNTIQLILVTSYRDNFNQVVIPSFEKAVTNMFQQTNDVFKRGTKEYLQEMIEYGRQQQRSLIQQREQMMIDIRKDSLQLSKEFEKASQELATTLKSETQQYLMEQLTPLIRERTQSIIREETKEIFRDLFTTQKREIENLLEAAAASTTVVQQAPTPPAQESKYQRISTLLQQAQWNQAFECALSASDLNLVLFVCETVSPNELFSIQPCPLQTPVLLSLIQQLSAELNHQQELKYRYLSEALICLDLSHPSVRDFSTTVLTDLSKKLSIHVQKNPSSSMNNRFQILLMTSQGLLQKVLQQRKTPMLYK